MKPSRKQPVGDLETRCPGGTPGRRAVRAKVAANKRARIRVEGWDEKFVVALAFVIAAVVALVTIYQTIGWARS
jgi:hypothetical protein